MWLNPGGHSSLWSQGFQVPWSRGPVVFWSGSPWSLVPCSGMFAGKQSCAAHFVRKRKGLRPPQPPGVLQPSMLPIRTSCLHHVCRKVVRIMLFANSGVPCCFTTIRASNKTIISSPCLQEGEVVRIILFANGGGCPPNPPLVLKPSMLARKR